MFSENYIPSSTGCQLYTCLWAPQASPKAVVVVVHGMAEHIGRYARFAEFLCEQNVAVLGFDLPGHGKSIGPNDTRGFFAAENGWDRLIDDIHTLCLQAKTQFPDIPLVLFGHSLGSYLLRSYGTLPEAKPDAYILSGAGGKNPALAMATVLAAQEIEKYGAKAVSKKLYEITFGNFNQPYVPARTTIDWFSSDDASVDAYLADPMCGIPMTAAAFRDLFDGLIRIQKYDWADNMANKPIYIFSGKDDPLSGKEMHGLNKVVEDLTEAGKNVTLQVYPGRHDMLHEKQYQQVQQDILAFIQTL